MQLSRTEPRVSQQMPELDQRSSVALYLQGRRRKRKAAQNPPGPAGLSDGLVAHFAFEESSGNRIDDVNGYVLQTVGDEVYTTYGLMGAGPAWNETGYLMGTQSTSLFSPSVNGFTVSIWVNFADIPDPTFDVIIAGIWDDVNWPSGSSWYIYSGAPDDGNIHVFVLGAGWRELQTFGDLTVWTHVCLVYEPIGSDWTLYLNGAWAAEVNFDYASAPGLLGVGAHTNSVLTPPQGVFDELAIWSRALSTGEIDALYNNGAGLPYPY